MTEELTCVGKIARLIRGPSTAADLIELGKTALKPIIQPLQIPSRVPGLFVTLGSGGISFMSGGGSNVIFAPSPPPEPPARRVELGEWYDELKGSVYTLVEMKRIAQHLEPKTVADLRHKVMRLRTEADAVRNALTVADEVFAIYEELISKIAVEVPQVDGP